MTPAGVWNPNTRAKYRYSSGPHVCRQTRHVQPISVTSCNAGTRTRSPAESRRNAVLAPHAGHGADSCLTLIGLRSDCTAIAHDSTRAAICSKRRVSCGRHDLAASARNRARPWTGYRAAIPAPWRRSRSATPARPSTPAALIG